MPLKYVKLFMDAECKKPLEGLDFGNPEVGSNVMKAVWVKNTKSSEIRVHVSCPHPEVKVEGSDLTLAAGESKMVALTFTPTEQFEDEVFEAGLDVKENYVTRRR